MKKTLSIEGMTCMHCSMHVEKALSEVEGVSKVKVDLKKNNAVIKAKDSVTDEMLVNAVKDAGYTLTTIN